MIWRVILAWLLCTGFAQANLLKHSPLIPVAHRQAYGFLNGTATMTALLDGNLMPVTTVGTNDNYQWWAQLQLTPGPHQLVVNALNWSGYYTASATNTFTNNAADHVVNGYGGNGEITNRVWISSNGHTNATESLSFDARDRLHSVTHLDSNTNGYNWSAAYDGYGRRLSTTTTYITNGVWLTNLATSIGQFYDPQARFLELGEMDGSGTTWKIYGPDANGVYGGMQGAGGLEAVVNGPRMASAVLSDARGNGLALYNVSQASLMWFPSRTTSYGAVPGYAPLPLTDGAKIAQSSAWHDKWPDSTGYYSLGKRVLDPISHTWLSADPLGHDADPSLLTFCGGDPVNSFDANGMCSESQNDSSPGSVSAQDLAYSLPGMSDGAVNAITAQFNALGLSGGMAAMSPLWAIASATGALPQSGVSYSVSQNNLGYEETQWGGQWLVDAALNGVQQDIANYQNVDSSGWGLAYGAVNTVKLGADLIGAVGNVITVGELGVMENGVKAGLTKLTANAMEDAADAALNQTYRLSAGADRSAILQMNRNLYDAFIESGGTFNSMRDVLNISSETGNQILGAYNSVENSISLYNGSNLSTISEELIHWTQIQRAGLIGQPIPKALVPSLEQSAQTTLLQWGYEPLQ